jgi:glycerate-2-kinase
MRREDETAFIRNREQLLSHGSTKLRAHALDIIEAGIAGGHPGPGSRKLIGREGDTLHIGENRIKLSKISRCIVAGAGKGSYPIAETLDEILGERINEGFVAVKSGEARRLKHIEIYESSHPVPDRTSVEAGKRILALAQSAGKNDLVIAAVTGGASSLAIVPPQGIAIDDLAELNTLLLESGAPISEINAVRKHLCSIKGGQFCMHARKARIIALTIDTRPENIPWPDWCHADPSTFSEAADILRAYGIWDNVSDSIRKHIRKGTAAPALETPKSLDGIDVKIVSVGSPSEACDAAAEKAKQLGYNPAVFSTALDGESRDAAKVLASIAQEIVDHGRPYKPPCALISSGETTVALGAVHGKGGPNQELALSFALHFGNRGEYVCASVGTDGTDGPTEIAGGIVDSKTRSLAQALPDRLGEYIFRHDCAAALEAMGDAIMTGHTGTNVLDLRVILIDKASHKQENYVHNNCKTSGI